MTLTDNGQYTGSFQGVSSYIPLVGVLLNKYENFDNFSQVKYNSSTQVVAGDPVIVKNMVQNNTSLNAIEGLSAVNGEITDIATHANNLSGFICQAPTDIVPLAGGEAFPQAGFLTYVALLGSGAQLYLRADSSLKNVDYNTRVTYDFSAKLLKKQTVGTSQPIPARLKSGLVNGKYLVYNAGTGKATWTDCTAVLVELVNMTETVETSAA